MPRESNRCHLAAIWCLVVLAAVLTASPVVAQDLEPRRWAHQPIGTHSTVLALATREAEIFFNPIIGITDGTADVNTLFLRYGYAFEWFGKTARVDGVLPYMSGTWQGLVDGEPGRRSIRDGGDPLLRVSLNLYGAPALTREAIADYFAEHPARTTVGVSLAVSLPLGAYDPEELINVGRNRYLLRPQIGVLHTRGSWSFELTGSVFVFGDNTDYLESLTLSQRPVYALQGHVTRNFNGGFWLGTGVAYATGGVIDIDRTRTRYEVDNLLWNLVGGYRITRRQSVVFSWQQGRTQTDVGTDYDSWALSWVYAWGSR
ncbi:MAG: transporter [Gammaproteobacteria bacterium]|nr:transporter [Gammaproteobacteria bacterium]